MKKQIFVLLGSTGNLAGIKIYPAIGRLMKDGYINPLNFKLIGVSYEEKTQADFQKYVLEHSGEYAGKEALIYDYIEDAEYVQTDILNDSFDKLAAKLFQELLSEEVPNQNAEVVFFLSIKPSLFMIALEQVARIQHMFKDKAKIKVMIEKPYGCNLENTEKINEFLGKNFVESQIYRIDHYLAKEGLRKLDKCRKENLDRWNSDGIEEISIVLAETTGVEERIEFYEETGAVIDVVQNHIFQILLNVLSSKGGIEGIINSLIPGKSGFHFMQYMELKTETLVYGRFYPELKEWQGVGFNLITGKRMAEKKTQIIIKFKTEKEPCVIDFLENSLTYLPEYPTLILNCLKGETENFVSAQEAVASWKFGDGIRKIAEIPNNTMKLEKYAPDQLTVDDILKRCRKF